MRFLINSKHSFLVLDFRFAMTPPSMIAAAAICVAFNRLHKSIGLICPTRQELITMMRNITKAEEVRLYFLLIRICTRILGSGFMAGGAREAIGPTVKEISSDLSEMSGLLI